MELTEEALDQAMEGAPPHPLFADIPPVLRPWLLPIKWDRDRLWGIHHNPIRVAISELRWLYDLPFWRDRDGRWFQVTPREFIEGAAKYPEHVDRVADADLSYPIHVLRRRQRFFILDGVHRLVRADLDGHDHIAAIVLTAEDIAAIASDGNLPT